MQLPDGLDHHHRLSAGQIASFREQGYIKLKGVLSPATLARFQPRFRQLVAECSRDLPPLEQRSTYGKAFLQIMNLWRSDAEARAFVVGRTLAGLAAALLEVPAVRLYHDQALFKEPGGGATPWHVDQFYWPLDTDRTITAWVPLQPTPLELGPLAFSAGSQRLDLGRHLAISDRSEAEIGRRLTLRQLPIDETPFDLGEVSFHLGWTFHRAGANRSSIPREVMTIIYFADGARLAAPANPAQEHDQRTWMPGAVVGEPVATPLNPVLFP